MTQNNDWDDALEQMRQVEKQLQEQVEQQQKPKGNKGVLLIGLVVAVAIVGGIIFMVMSSNSEPPPPPTVIEQDPTEFDPQISLETVQRFAGENLRFLSLTMTQVRPDGTIDFSAGGNPTVEYTFVTGNDSEFVIVSVAPDLTMSRRTQSLTAGTTLPLRVEPPSCDIPQLWQLAKTYNAPNNGVADINYDTSGYNFVIGSLEIDLQFNGECILIRD